MLSFTDDQQDILREIANLAMGEAGVKLSQVLNAYIVLSIPLIRTAAIGQVAQILTELNADLGDTISIVRLGFQGFLEGEALLLHGPRTIDTIAELLGESSAEDQEGMLLREISNILAAACLNGIAQRLATHIIISPPSMYCHRMPMAESFGAMFSTTTARWHETLLTKIAFRIENQDFQCNLILFLAETCITKLQNRLDQILSEM